jgi:hypothetical protein
MAGMAIILLASWRRHPVEAGMGHPPGFGAGSIIFGATGMAGATLVWNMAGLGFAPFLFDGGLLGFLILALRDDNGIWLRALTQARSRRSQ